MKNSFKEKIQVIYPENNFAVYGIYTRKEDGRKYIVVVNKINGKLSKRLSKCSSVMLARIKMEIKLGRRLKQEEEVDHKDEDPTNDRYSNLQILTGIDNKQKAVKDIKELAKIRNTMTCPACKSSFRGNQSALLKAQSKNRKPCCSRKCASKMYGKNQYGKF